MRRPILFSAFISLLLACSPQAKEPVVPPSQAGPSSTPRFDGAYVSPSADPKQGVDLLRFFADGHVLSLSTSSPQSVDTAVRMLAGECERCATGKYEIKDNVLRFVMTSKLGSVEYAGAATGDRLVVRWRSAINGASLEETFAFRRVEDTAAKVETSAKPEDAETATETIPEGAEWFCFRVPKPSLSRCERKLAACETARKSHKDAKTARCTKQSSAYCFTVVGPTSTRSTASCAATEDDCKTELTRHEAERDGPDERTSTCARQ